MKFLDNFLIGYYCSDKWSHVCVKIQWLYDLNVHHLINTSTSYIHYKKSSIYLKYPEDYNIFKDAYRNKFRCNPGLTWRLTDVVKRAERYDNYLAKLNQNKSKDSSK